MVNDASFHLIVVRYPMDRRTRLLLTLSRGARFEVTHSSGQTTQLDGEIGVSRLTV